MPHTQSAKKRLRQNAKRRARNRSTKRAIKTYIKKLDAALSADNLSSDEGKKNANDTYRLTIKKLDQAVAKGTLHKNTVSRKKSQLARRLHEATS